MSTELVKISISFYDKLLKTKHEPSSALRLKKSCIQDCTYEYDEITNVVVSSGVVVRYVTMKNYLPSIIIMYYPSFHICFQAM